MTHARELHLGPYEVMYPIGVGSLGTVYMATDTNTLLPVALKVFDTPGRRGEPLEMAERVFVTEFRAAAALRHPHIASILEVGREGAYSYVAMECVFKGRSLARYCAADEQRLPMEDVVRIVKRCAEALHHAHTHGVVHRDVKPRNILLDVGLEPKLIDFGIAVLVPPDAEDPHLAGRAQRYLAPEQVLAHAVTHHADLFSLGVVLYELLTGRHPFEADGVAAQHRRIVEGRHVPVRKSRSDVPRVLQTIINRCLAKRPSDRFQTAMHLSANLDVALDVLASSSSAVAQTAIARRLRRLPAFTAFSARELTETIAHSSFVTYRPGDEIVAPGDTAACLYVVVDGEVGVRTVDLEFEPLGAGSCFGEVGALTGAARTATVVALDRCGLLCVPMSFLMHGPPGCQLHLKNMLLQAMARRLAEATGSVC